MEPQQKDFNAHHSKEADIDLGVLLYKAGKAVSRFFAFLGRCILTLLEAFLFSLLFLRRNILWLLLGTSLGLGYGIYQNLTSGSKYSSKMIVRANFGSARALYNSIDYLNALINSSNASQLSSIFGITAKEAYSLSYFSVEPIEDELIVAEMYNQNFLQFEKNNLVRTDTFWSKTIKFQDFKSLITKYDYPLHQINTVSTDQVIFKKLQNGILNLVSQNEVLQNNKLIAQQTNAEEESVLKSSIESLDTLRRTYNQKLLLRGGNDGGGSVVNLIDKSGEINSPELEIYDKILLMNGQVKLLRKRLAENKDIIQVYAPYNNFGNKQSVLRQSYFSQALSGLIITVIVLIIIALNKSLGKMESDRKSAKIHNETSI